MQFIIIVNIIIKNNMNFRLFSLRQLQSDCQFFVQNNYLNMPKLPEFP